MPVSAEKLTQFLGAPRYHYEKAGKKPEVGVVNGLAYTVVGGDTLQIETTIMPGSGQLELTGSLGDVMKESAKAAKSYVRAHAEEFAIDPEFYKKLDIHIHVPEGAVPKDGPSAGVTMTTALVSALTEITSAPSSIISTALLRTTLPIVRCRRRTPASRV